MRGWGEWATETTRTITEHGRWRAPKVFDARGLHGFGREPDRSRLVTFASNDYLGLSTHPQVIAAAHLALDRWGAGAGASRLVVGTRPVHEQLENALADWKRSPRCILFPTGYAANIGVIASLTDSEAVIFSDELNHASIVDGCRMSRSEVFVFPHRDYSALEALLATRARGRRALVVSDLVFSMDGDVADIEQLGSVCTDHEALLVLDEAHAALELTYDDSSLHGADVLHVGTLSKMLGSLGGFVAGSAEYIALLENRARPYIFTTAPSPADSAAALCALGILRSSEGDELRRRLRAHVDAFIPMHPSPIVPIICGSEERAVAASDALAAEGYLVPAIRPPTVAPGTSRLRVALSCAHSDAEVQGLIGALEGLGLAVPGTAC